MTHRRRTDDADQTVLELAEAWADSWLASAGTEPPEDLPHERALFRAIRARREPCVPEQDFAVEKYNEAYSRKSAERRVLDVVRDMMRVGPVWMREHLPTLHEAATELARREPKS